MNRAKIMIVEDESITARALKESATSFGYDVVATVGSGEEAITTARQTHLDVILMDIKLRGLVDGITAAETIRKEVGVPCIYMTAYSDAQTLARAKVSEPYGYIVKPYDEKELRAAIEIAIHNSAMDRDRRAAQAALEGREKLLQDVMDNSGAIIYMKDLDGRYTAVNRQFEDFIGVKRADVRGKDDHEALPPAFKDAFQAFDDLALRSATVTQTEQELGPEGRRRRYVVSRFPLRRMDRTVYGVGAFMMDITELKRVETQLRETEARYRMVAESTTDLIILSKADGTIVYVSPATRHFGYSPEELTGRTRMGLVHPDDIEQARNLPPPTDGRPGPPICYRIRKKDGEFVWVESHVQSVAQKEPGPPLTLTVTRDITDRRRAEDEIRRLQAELDERVRERTSHLAKINADLESFTRSASHDLSAPIRGLAHLSEALLEDHASELSPEALKITMQLHAESARLGSLVSRMLALAREGETELGRTTVDLTQIARETIATLQQSEPDRKVTVSITEAVTAEGDALLLRVVMENLLGNAWKFTRKSPDGRIEFGVTNMTSGERAYFVRDNGAGFNPSQASRLFTPFQRLHTQSEFSGTGLGLSGAKRIIERHGGHIWAEGEPGRGATFYFTIPSRGHSPSPTDAESAPHD